MPRGDVLKSQETDNWVDGLCAGELSIESLAAVLDHKSVGGVGGE